MKTPDSNLPKIEQITYSLSVEDFNKPPATVVDYNVGDRVTRENFVSFFTTTFFVSRGIQYAQIAFCIWLKKMYGFDAMETLRNFLASGGWNALSQEEQARLISEFERIKEGHRKLVSREKIKNKRLGKEIELDFENLVNKETLEQIMRTWNHEEFGPSAEIPLLTRIVRDVHTFAELQERLARYIKTTK